MVTVHRLKVSLDKDMEECSVLTSVPSSKALLQQALVPVELNRSSPQFSV